MRPLPPGYSFFLIPERRPSKPYSKLNPLPYVLRTPRRDLRFPKNQGALLALFIANPGKYMRVADLFDCLYFDREDGGPDDYRSGYFQTRQLQRRMRQQGIQFDLESASPCREILFRFHGLREMDRRGKSLEKNPSLIQGAAAV